MPLLPLVRGIGTRIGERVDRVGHFSGSPFAILMAASASFPMNMARAISVSSVDSTRITVPSGPIARDGMCGDYLSEVTGDAHFLSARGGVVGHWASLLRLL
ncbi:hypothetical protein GS438_26175 [Rhodococcus hoagii]|nr:hypothetical protein [Prescottella equi]